MSLVIFTPSIFIPWYSIFSTLSVFYNSVSCSSCLLSGRLWIMMFAIHLSLLVYASSIWTACLSRILLILHSLRLIMYHWGRVCVYFHCQRIWIYDLFIFVMSSIFFSSLSIVCSRFTPLSLRSVVLLLSLPVQGFHRNISPLLHRFYITNVSCSIYQSGHEHMGVGPYILDIPIWHTSRTQWPIHDQLIAVLTVE